MFNSFESAFLNSSSGSETDWISLSPYSLRGSACSNKNSSCSSSYTSAKSLQNSVDLKSEPKNRSTAPNQSLALEAEFPTGCRLMDFSNCSTDSNLSTMDESDLDENDTSAILQRYMYYCFS